MWSIVSSTRAPPSSSSARWRLYGGVLGLVRRTEGQNPCCGDQRWDRRFCARVFTSIAHRTAWRTSRWLNGLSELSPTFIHKNNKLAFGLLVSTNRCSCCGDLVLLVPAGL